MAKIFPEFDTGAVGGAMTAGRSSFDGQGGGVQLRGNEKNPEIASNKDNGGQTLEHNPGFYSKPSIFT